MIAVDRRYAGLTRWKVWPFAKGAYGPLGGHWKVLGVNYRWNQGLPAGWSKDSGLSIWGLVSIVHMDTEGGTLKTTGPEWKVNFLRIDWKAAIRPASPY